LCCGGPEACLEPSTRALSTSADSSDRSQLRTRPVRQALDFRGPVGPAAWWRGATEPEDRAQQDKVRILPVEAIAPGGAMCIVQMGQSHLFAQRISHKASVDRALSRTGLRNDPGFNPLEVGRRSLTARCAMCKCAKPYSTHNCTWHIPVGRAKHGRGSRWPLRRLTARCAMCSGAEPYSTHNRTLHIQV
jgi:hypothetical protein